MSVCVYACMYMHMCDGVHMYREEWNTKLRRQCKFSKSISEALQKCKHYRKIERKAPSLNMAATLSLSLNLYAKG